MVFHPMMDDISSHDDIHSSYTITVTYSVDSGFQSTKPVTFLPTTSSGLKISIIDPSSKYQGDWECISIIWFTKFIIDAHKMHIIMFTCIAS